MITLPVTDVTDYDDFDDDDGDALRSGLSKNNGEEPSFFEVEEEYEVDDPEGALEEDNVANQEEPGACEESGYEEDDDSDDYGDEIEQQWDEPVDVEDEDVDIDYGGREYNDDDDVGGCFMYDSSGNSSGEESGYYDETEEVDEAEEVGKNRR